VKENTLKLENDHDNDCGQVHEFTSPGFSDDRGAARGEYHPGPVRIVSPRIPQSVASGNPCGMLATADKEPLVPGSVSSLYAPRPIEEGEFLLERRQWRKSVVENMIMRTSDLDDEPAEKFKFWSWLSDYCPGVKLLYQAQLFRRVRARHDQAREAEEMGEGNSGGEGEVGAERTSRPFSQREISHS